MSPAVGWRLDGAGTMTDETFLTAIRDRDVRRARALLDEDPGLAEARTSEGTSALMLALYLRLDDVVDRLLEAGAQPDVFEAAVLGDLGRLRRLLDQDPSRVGHHASDGFTPLHLAAHFGQLRALGALRDRGADLEAEATNEMANRPLHAAAAGCQEGAVRILAEEGATVDARDAMGNTPLHVAAANGHLPTVQRLLDAGADPTARNQEGRSPGDIADDRGFTELAEHLARVTGGA